MDRPTEAVSILEKIGPAANSTAIKRNTVEAILGFFLVKRCFPGSGLSIRTHH